ncbi:MAG: hypothetical protein IJS12_03985 [Lachnospiraceae bacterium]|nr:hypothetical protein [Lachnospiraceae bacterium]
MKKRLYKKIVIVVLLGLLTFSPAVQAAAVTDTGSEVVSVNEEKTEEKIGEKTEEKSEEKTDEKSETENIIEDEERNSEDTDVETSAGEDEGKTGSETEDESDDVTDDETAYETDDESAETENSLPLAKSVRGSVATAGLEPLAARAGAVSGDAVADDQDAGKAVSISIVSVVSVDGENKIAVSAEFYDANGDVPRDISRNYSVWFYSSGSANKNLITTETNSITKYIQSSSSKDFDVYFELRSADGELISSTEHIPLKTVKVTTNKVDFTLTASADNEDTGVIEYTGTGDISRLAYYPKNNTSDVKTVEGKTITGLKPGNYYVYSPAYSDGYTFYLKSSAASLTVSGGGIAPVKEYKVSTSGDDNVKFNRNVQVVKDGNDASVSVKPVNDKTHYIDADSIRIEPAENFVSYSFYSPTGDLTITGVKGDITVFASSKEKQTVSSLSVKNVSFNENGNYSESSPVILTTIEVEAKDKNGNPVPEITLYFKPDQNEVSFSQSRKTDENGIARFKYSYGINRENDETQEDYSPVFATDSEFKEITTTTDIHLVLQLRQDLVLYTDQLIGTFPGENTGKVINVPDNYELWTGEVHQGYLVVGSGEWVHPVNGEFLGLSAGQHLIRAGEKRGEDGTFYFASNYADFFIPRGSWQITTDTVASEHVLFSGDVIQTAEPGGIVYIYVTPEQGYEITEYSADKPKYVSGGLRYDKEKGYIVIDGISGSLKLTVKATKIDTASSGSGSTQGTPAIQVLTGSSSDTTAPATDSTSGASVPEADSTSGASAREADSTPVTTTSTATSVATSATGISQSITSHAENTVAPAPQLVPVPAHTTPAVESPAVLPASRNKADTAGPVTAQSKASGEKSVITDDPTAKAGTLPTTAHGENVTDENATFIVWPFIIVGLAVFAAAFSVYEIQKKRIGRS